MIGRYVLATAAVVLLVVGLLLGAVVYLGLHYGEAADSRVRIGTLAEALIPTADGLQLDPARTPADWPQGCGPGVPGPCGECDIFLFSQKNHPDFSGFSWHNPV